MLRHLRLVSLMLLAALAGCDQLGIESASAVAARKESEGKAIGGACRHAGRAIEDCYAMNRRADKGAVFAGWREMNDYMRENKIEAIAPSLPHPSGTQTAAAKEEPEPAAQPTAPAKASSKSNKH